MWQLPFATFEYEIKMLRATLFYNSRIEVARFYIFPAGGFMKRRFPLEGIFNPIDLKYIPAVFSSISSLPPFNVPFLLPKRPWILSLYLPFVPFLLPPFPSFLIDLSLPLFLSLHDLIFVLPSKSPSCAVNYEVLARITVHATTFTFARDPLDFPQWSKDVLFRNVGACAGLPLQSAMQPHFLYFFAIFLSSKIRTYFIPRGLSRRNLIPYLFRTMIYIYVNASRTSVCDRIAVSRSLPPHSSLLLFSPFPSIFILIYDCLLFYAALV